MLVTLDIPALDGLSEEEINRRIAEMCKQHQATLTDARVEEVDGPYSGLIVQLSVELPCGTSTEAGYCGKPAKVARVQARMGGEFAILPVCRDCAIGAR